MERGVYSRGCFYSYAVFLTNTYSLRAGLLYLIADARTTALAGPCILSYLLSDVLLCVRCMMATVFMQM